MTSADERPARLDVGVVGAGRVGAVLGAALQRVGHRVVAVSGVSEQSRTRAAQLLPGIPVVSPEDVVRRSELVLLAVPDDALADLVAGLSATRAWQAGQLVAHTSGRHGLEVYAPALDQHVLGLALHPAMTFTGTGLDLERLVECCFGVTAPEPLRPVAEALVLEIGAEPVWIEEPDRPLYHAALAHGANHLVTLVAQSLQALRAAGVEKPSRVLGPLVSAALDNALRAGDAALTGPVARGDAGTVAEHLRQLQHVSPDIRPTYLALARATAERALASGRLKPHVAEPLLDILATDQER
ncbi:putative short-subunit dehydrogenase-like oxidoreductase (DUF2520 family) [Phycicoccus badiiscoriae]|uniref:Putative short-subunit dehydrogenase-like oxidoreductase (DUF2520 family) n=1 Tax=Pedococcus badiiscoriae TaxID=642776 RepID=A0A852WMM3_9MICO|nr:putative short-subunit dehydrogenase-like oxidoreductase (DUF2520 family) [Pedococcus badiiscoriae]